MISKLVYFLFIICFIFVETNSDSIAEDMEIISDCNATHPLNKSNLNKALMEQNFVEMIDENFKCFLFCIYNRYGWMTDEGIFEKGSIQKTLKESSLTDAAIDYLINKCAETDITDKCERAFYFTDCIWAKGETRDGNLNLPYKDTLFSDIDIQ